MKAFRDVTPKRSDDVANQTDYRKYRVKLSDDFNHRCGYCNDFDSPRSVWFEIDHFKPKDIDASSVTDYFNLVYACRSCNNSKRDKWPTGDKDIPNDGSQGWVDPCDEEYISHFERTDNGKIVSRDSLGAWMIENLKLWKIQHELLWNYEQLEINSKILEEKYKMQKLPKEKMKLFIDLLLKQKAILKSFYSL